MIRIGASAFLAASVAAAGLALVLAGCSKEEPAQSAATPAAAPAAPAGPTLAVKIGIVAPLTGPQSHIGKDLENAVDMAAEDANNAKIMVDGKQLHFDVDAEDDQADPKTAVVVAQKLVDSKVNAVIGHFNSGTTIPASKLYSDAGIPQISPSATNPQYTNQGFKTTYRVVANDNQQGKVVGDYIANTLHAKALAVIDDRTPYGQGVADVVVRQAKADGVKIVDREYTTDKSTDFKAILTAIKGKKPDAIFFGGIDTQAGPMLQQLKGLGITAQFVGADGIQSTELFKLGGDAVEGTLASFPGLPIEKMANGLSFNDKYKAKFNQDVVLYAPQGYDAFNVFVDAIKRAGSADSAKILAQLPSTDYQGITGPIKFDDKGDIKDGPITIFKATGGKWQAVATIGGAGAAASGAAGAAGSAGGASGGAGGTADAAGAATSSAPAKQ